MAGYTSRSVLLTAVSSCVTVLSLVWLLRKKKTTVACESSENNKNCSRPVYPFALPMNSASEGSYPELVACPSKICKNNMQLKEDSHSTAEDQDTSSVKSKVNAGVEKCKVYVNGTTCSAAVEKQVDNKLAASDKADNIVAAPQTCKEAMAFLKEAETSSCIAKDESSELICRLDALDLGSASSTSNGDITHNGSHMSNGYTNGNTKTSLPTKEVSSEHSCEVVPGEESGVLPSEFSLGSPHEQITCEVNIVPKPASPDSGLSAESQDSDGASSPLSDPSVDGPGGNESMSPYGLDDRLRDFNENLLDSPSPGLEVVETIDSETVIQVFEFEIPQDLCGLLIGRNGRYVKHIKQESNADIFIKHHAYYTHMKMCIVSGTVAEITHAMQLIRERFPATKYPELTLACVSYFQRGVCLPISMKLTMPPDVKFEVIVSSIVSPLHFFVHQPTHPTYHTLSLVSNSMSEFYSNNDTPSLIHFEKSFIVAVPLEGGWYRAEITEVHSDGTGTVKLLDFGGFVDVKLEDLRQLNCDFLVFPFQATECYMGNITYPEGEEKWSDEAKSAFEELSQGQIVYGYVTGYDDSGPPYVHLFKFENNSPLCINRELVTRGLASWLEDIEEVTE